MATDPVDSSTHRTAPRIAFIFLVVVCAASLLLTGLLSYQHWSSKRAVTESSRTQLVGLTSKAAASIDAIARDTTAIAESLAADLTTGTLKKEAIVQRIKDLAEQHPHVYGITVAYMPFAFDPGKRLHAPYYAKLSGRLEYVQVETMYDYTRPEHEWFSPVIEHGARWTQPYYGAAGMTLMMVYSTPFYRVDPNTRSRVAIGVVAVPIAMDEFRRIIESFDLGPSGFGSLVSETGSYLYHPNPEFVQARKSLQDVAREQNDADRLALVDRVLKRESGVMEHRSVSTGLASWLIYGPVASTGWSLQNTFILDDLPLDIDRLRQQLIWVLMSLLVCVSAAMALVSRAHTGKERNLWVASSAIAVMIAAAIGALWVLSLTYDSHSQGEGIRISDKATLNSVMNTYTRTSAERHTEPPVFVPTGLFVESAHFSAPNDLSVTGYLWQKYTVGAHDGLSRGFTIGEATEMEARENYRTTEHGVEIVRWHFHGTIRQALDHSKYPLEQEKISLRILHNDLNHNVVLVPDLGSYTFLNPSSRPGLEKDLVFPGWYVTSSFFELRNKRYDSNFGIDRSLAKELFPSLYFNIVIKRNLVDAFISNLTALIIVAILLFTLLMLTIKDEQLVGRLQIGTGRILSICAAMFFVIAFNHVDIRRKLAAEDMFFLEYFYLLIYVAILWVSINSVVFSTGAGGRLIHYKSNLISKLLFWPVLLAVLLAISIVTFY